MDPKEKDLLERTFEYARENNRLIKKMRSAARFGSFIRLVYWVVIIGSSIGLYYFIQPFLSDLMDIYEQVINLKNTIPSFQ